MKTKLAIITAACWKGAGSFSPDVSPLCPEALLPLGDGTTVLSRVCRQLKDLGYIVFAGIGRPGCLFPRWADFRSRQSKRGKAWITPAAADLARIVSPWTWERIAYVNRHAIPVLVPDPDNGSKHDTQCAVLDVIGAVDSLDWQHIVFLFGDEIYTDSFLRDKLTKSRIPGRSAVLFLTPKLVRAYRILIEQFRGWSGRSYFSTNGKRMLQDIGIPVGLSPAEQKIFTSARGWERADIDHPVAYASALQWIQRYGKGY